MRHVVCTTAFTMLLVAGTTVAAAPSQTAAPATSATPAPAASTVPATSASPTAAAGTAPSTPPLSPADRKRVAAIEQYQHDLVSVVALRAQPDYLLGAAILARPFKDQTPGLDFDALSERAAAAPVSGAAPRWQRLGECQTKADCPNAAAFAWLKQHAAGNAAVWLVELDRAAANDDAEAEQAALRKAAAAQVYDDYYGKALAGVAKAVAVLPPLPDTTTGAHDGQPDNPAGVRVLVAVNATQGLPRPDLEPVVALCDKDAVDKDPDAAKACLKLAHTLQWGSSPVARAAGLHIQGQLEPDNKAKVEQGSRDLAWQVHQYSALLQHSLTDPTQASRWLDSARNGGTELSLILATLRANGVPLDAPARDASAPAPADSAAH